MITRRLHGLRSRLASLYSLADKQQDIAIQSQLARYLCILTLGLVEQTMQILAVEYAKAHARAEITNYLSQSVSYLRTPNFERVRQFCGAFSQSWLELLDGRVKEDQKIALNSVHSIRNTLAHGDDYPLSLGIMKDYYKRILALLDVLEAIFEP